MWPSATTIAGSSADNSRALDEYAKGQTKAPANADLLRGRGLAEQALGRWDSALVHLREAQTLDPRSATIADRLCPGPLIAAEMARGAAGGGPGARARSR